MPAETKQLARRFATILASVCVAAVGSGCAGGLARDLVIRHPDAPMLITEADGRAQVSVFDAESGTLIHAGTVDLGQLQGWTLSRFDWQTHARRWRERQGEP